MSKKVLSIMPGNRADTVYVSDDATFLTVTLVYESGASSILETPIESMEIDGVTHYFVRYASMVPEDEIKALLLKY